jgi:hypothetical protein
MISGPRQMILLVDVVGSDQTNVGGAKLQLDCDKVAYGADHQYPLQKS